MTARATSVVAIFRAPRTDLGNPRVSRGRPSAARKSRFVIRARRNSRRAQMECHEIYTTGTSSRWINNTDWHPAPSICLFPPCFLAVVSLTPGSIVGAGSSSKTRPTTSFQFSIPSRCTLARTIDALCILQEAETETPAESHVATLSNSGSGFSGSRRD